jgi:hypothetical protein
MKIEIDFARNRPKVGGGVDIVGFDREFQKKLEDFMERELEEDPGMHFRDSAYHDFRKAYGDLIRVVERILPEETETPFQIVINVKGEVDHSPGPRLY